MLPIEKLKNIKRIVTHANCSDGIASALILHDVFFDAEFIFCAYGTKEYLELPALPNTLFCDIIPPVDRYKEFIEAGAIVLDHHKSAQDIVKEFGELGIFADEKNEPGVSGTVLAFREVWQPLYSMQDKFTNSWLSDFSKAVGVRDTWVKDSPHWETGCEYCAALMFYGFERLRYLATNELATKLTIGKILREKDSSQCDNWIKKSFRFSTLKGTKVIFFQGCKASSDVAEKLGDEVDLVIGFEVSCQDGKEKLSFSIRSHTDFDCAALAKSFEGGGHTKAAGFQYVMKPGDLQPYSLIQSLLADW